MRYCRIFACLLECPETYKNRRVVLKGESCVLVMSDLPELEDLSFESAPDSPDSTPTLVPDSPESISTVVDDPTAEYCRLREELRSQIPPYGLTEFLWPVFVVKLRRCWVSVVVLLPGMAS